MAGEAIKLSSSRIPATTGEAIKLSSGRTRATAGGAIKQSCYISWAPILFLRVNAPLTQYTFAKCSEATFLH